MRHLFTAILLGLTLSTGAKDVKTVVFTTQPQMHCQNCENRIKQNVRFVKGVSKIETDVKHQRVTIEYDADKTTPEKISEAFRKIGYEATTVEAGNAKSETKKKK